MKNILITIAAVLVVGCGEATPEISIYEAAETGNIEVIKQHLAAGVNVNAKKTDGGAPLHYAAALGQTKTVVLINNGADVKAESKDGWTPLHYAAHVGNKEVSELLISKGADVDGKGFIGLTPLHHAVVKGRMKVAELLRKHGGKTSAELALIPRLEYGKNQWPFDFSFTAKKGKTYVVEVTQDFKQWGELEAIKGTGKRVKFIDPRQPLVQFKRNFYRVKVVE